MRNVKIFTLILIIFSFQSLSASVHLPMQDKHLYRQLEKLLVFTNSSKMTKPYSLKYIEAQLQYVQEERPSFYSYVKVLLKPYQENFDLNGSLQLSVTDDSSLESVVPNTLGNQSQSNGSSIVTTQLKVRDWFALSVGGSSLNSFEDNQFYNTYISVGVDSLQLDVGYRSFWVSPFQSRAMLNSNNAKQTLSAVLFNPVPLSFGSISYEIFLRQMERQNNVLVNGELTSGSPYILGTHVSFEPLDGLSVALNRTFQFGGRGKSISVSEVWDAFTDAVGSDNSGALGTCSSDNISNCEFGNQRASVTLKYNFIANVPFSVYGEYAGEDAASHSNFFLGNIAVSAGIYFPLLNVFDFDSSVSYEITEYQNAWHGHHIYREGYRIDGVSSGHWGTNYVIGNEKTAGLSQHLRFDAEKDSNLFVAELYYHQNKLGPGQISFPVDYSDVFNLSLTYIDLANPKWQYKVEFGQNYLGESTWAGSLQWGF